MVRQSPRVALTLILPIFAAVGLGAEERVRHSLKIDLDPVTHEVEIADTIQVPAQLAANGADFLLSAELEIRSH